MNLQNYTLAERQKLTSHYPALVVGSNSAGKSYAVEQLPIEEKQRTDVFNFDTKPIGDGTTNEFHNVYTILSSSEGIDKQIAAITAMGVKLKAENERHPALAGLRDQMNAFNKIKENSFFIDDIEAIDKIVDKVMMSAFNPDVDRQVVDTLTALTDFCEAWANANFSGREVWANYGKAHQRVLQAFKEATMFCYKYVYIMAHHDFIPPLQYPTTPKQVVKVKGGIMSGNVERDFNTIVFTHMNQEGHRMFECDVSNPLDTSRTKLVNSKFSFERKSLDDLEQIFAGKKKVNAEHELVEV